MAEESEKSSSSNLLKKSASFFSCTRGGRQQTTHSSPSSSSTDSPPPTPPPSPRPPPPASSSSSSRPPPPPPSYFTCPISSSLMSEPVAIPSGHSFERSCIQACIDLNFIPPNSPQLIIINTPPLILTPNHTLRRAIHDWCRHSQQPLPSTILHEGALEIIKKIKQAQSPPPSPSRETIQERILREIQEPFPSSQHSALRALIQNPFCTPEILNAILHCLTSEDYSPSQTLAARALYALSLDPANLHMIFHSDDSRTSVTHILDIIGRTTGSRASKFATGVVYKLTVVEAYRHDIGLRWGGIRILLDQFCRSYIGRKKAMLAIYYLCIHLENLGELIEAGGVGKLVAVVDNLGVVRSWTAKRYALILLYQMMLTERGREEMLEGGGIEVLVKRIAECKNGGDDLVPVGVHCLNVMYTVCRSQSLMRFREVASAAGAEEVLVEEVEEWESVGIQIARAMVSVIRGEISEEEEMEEDELDIDVEVEIVENEDSEDEEWVHELFHNFVV